MQEKTHFANNGAGWLLEIKQFFSEKSFDPQRKPLLIIPGYGMNTFIFGYHPNGLSLVEYLAKAGFEVFTANLRTQGGSIRRGGRTDYGFKEALVDIDIALQTVLAKTETKASTLDLIGCSLGGTFVYAYAALNGTNRINALIGLGAPLRWENIHPILRFAFKSPKLAKALKVSHTRQLAKLALPVFANHFPGLLSIYLHPEIVDLSNPEILTQTVEDPVSQLNYEIAKWVNTKDLFIDGQNVSEAFRDVTKPLLVFLSNADGIVPEATALSALHLAGSEKKTALVAGNEEAHLAHADMYISRYAQSLVFEPLAKWLMEKEA